MHTITIVALTLAFTFVLESVERGRTHCQKFIASDDEKIYQFLLKMLIK